MPTQKPRARSDDLVIEEVDDELLVYDSTNKRGHCLSATAARVWRACDGYSDVSAISEALELSADEVSQALDELEALELLDAQGLNVVQAGSGNGNGLTRRQLAGRSARVGAGIAAVPLIYSINVSSAMALQTPTPFACFLFTGQGCGTSTSCGRTAGCCCCCQGDFAACKICGSVAFCEAGKQPCPGGTFGTHCSSSGDETADDRGCCGFTGAMNCGCGFGGPGLVGDPKSRCCNRNTGANCTPNDNDPNCVPCCASSPIPQPGPGVDTSRVTPLCCTSAAVNCCDAAAVAGGCPGGCPGGVTAAQCCDRGTATIDCCSAAGFAANPCCNTAAGC